jgi:integrase
MGVRVREEGGAWYIFINHQGKRKAKRVGVGPAAKKAADAAAAKIAAKLTLGDLKIFEPDAPVPTVKAVAAEWLRVSAPNWKSGTVRNYESIVAAKIIPAFGALKVTEWTPSRIEDWWVRQRESGLDRKTLANYRGVLRGIAHRALVQELITKDPSLRIAGRLGRRDGEIRKVDFLSGDELNAMLRAAERVCPRFFPLFVTLAATGMRIGEGLAVQPGDLDSVGLKVLVLREVGRGGNISSPKNGEGRAVEVPDTIMALLVKQAQIVQAEAAVRGVEATWLFPGDIVGRPLTESPVREALQKALAAAGVRRIHPHILRHTYATLAIQAGVDILTVSRQLGHKDIGTTIKTYCHAVPGTGREAAAVIGAILANAGSPQFHKGNASAASPAQVTRVTP